MSDMKRGCSTLSVAGCVCLLLTGCGKTGAGIRMSETLE
jgi:hypothetical protein